MPGLAAELRTSDDENICLTRRPELTFAAAGVSLS
jgi:hypothetical protein